jgi:hypothetical protein
MRLNKLKSSIILGDFDRRTMLVRLLATLLLLAVVLKIGS